MEALRRMVCKPVYACDIIFYKFTPRHEKLKCFHASVQHHPPPCNRRAKNRHAFPKNKYNSERIKKTL